MVDPVQAVVPAAGRGTRMQPLTDDRPKGLVEVAGRPLLEHVLGAIEPVAEECVVVVGYRGDQIVEHLGEQYRGVDITYVTQSEREGLAHALLQAEPHVEGPFVSLNGDNVLRADIEALVERHREADASVTTLVERVSPDRASEGAVFELAADNGETSVSGLVEKPDDPPSALVPRGCYVFSEQIFNACRLVVPGRTGERELTDAVDLLLAAGWHLEMVPLDGWCQNVNTPADRDRVTRRLSG